MVYNESLCESVCDSLSVKLHSNVDVKCVQGCTKAGKQQFGKISKSVAPNILGLKFMVVLSYKHFWVHVTCNVCMLRVSLVFHTIVPLIDLNNVT